jgi:carboxymethylenebutenolidase
MSTHHPFGSVNPVAIFTRSHRFRLAASVFPLATLVASGCSRRPPEADTHAAHESSPSTVATQVANVASIPAGATTVADRLAKSPRHGEYVMIRTGPSDSVRAWVVYPERSSKAPVVVVVHEIFGLSSWVRGVADQLAADGFVAIAPDLLTGKLARVPGSDTVAAQAATAAIRSLRGEDVQRQIAAVGQYGMSLPAAEKRYGVVGFCWGGSVSFESAVRSPAGQGAAVVYYGTSPATASLASVKVPVLGLYGGEDARVGATIPAADSAMRALGKRFEHHTFAGAGHGFLRQQDGQGGANLAAAQQAWPMTIAFFRSTLGR